MIKVSKEDCLKMVKNLRKGDLLYWRDYVVPSGKIKGKILLVLNNCKYNTIVFFVLTTSQIKFYRNPQNKIDTIFFKAGKIKCFNKDTIIDLKHWQMKTIHEIGTKFYNNILMLIGRLPEPEIKYLDEVVTKATTLDPQTKNLILEN